MKRSVLALFLCSIIIFVQIVPRAVAAVESVDYSPVRKIKGGQDAFTTACEYEEILYGGEAVECGDSEFMLKEGQLYWDGRAMNVAAVEGDNLNTDGNFLYFTDYSDGIASIKRVDINGGEASVVLDTGSEKIKNMYVVSESFIFYLAGGIVYQCNMDGTSVERISPMTDVFSFIPTYDFIIYAVGEVTDYTLYIDDMLVASHVSYYAVKDSHLVVTVDGIMYQITMENLVSTVNSQKRSARSGFDLRSYMDPFNLYGTYSAEDIIPDNSEQECETCAEGYDPNASGGGGGVIQFPVQPVIPTPGERTIINRGNRLAFVEWTCLKSFSAYNREGQTNYIANQTYYAMPYSQSEPFIGSSFTHGYVGEGNDFNMTMTEFLEEVADINSEFYQAADYSGKGALYGADCSSLVCYAWGVARKTSKNFSQFAEIESAEECCGQLLIDNVGNVNRSHLATLRPGDALVYHRNGGGHCILITGVAFDNNGDIYSITTIEEKSPFALQTTYSEEEDASSTISDFIAKVNGDNYKFYRMYSSVFPSTGMDVTFEANGGTVSEWVREVKQGEQYGTLPIPERLGYTFQGWYLETYFSTKIVGTTIVEKELDHTLYAKWTANQYTVFHDINYGDNSKDSMLITVTYGQPYGDLPTVSRTGYTFNGWFTSPTGGAKVTSSTIVTTAANHTLYAQWTPKSYTVTFNANGGTVVPRNMTVTYGSPYGTLPTPAREGYYFMGWYTALTGGTRVAADTVVSTASSHALYARWYTDDDIVYEHIDPELK